jgi:hypothetical protein
MLILFAGAALSGAAQAADVYTVSDVRVDEKAPDEVSAKSVGLAKAEQEALRSLFERLTPAADHPQLPQITKAMVSRAVRDFTVAEEKFGGGRYLASLSVRFKAKAVRSLLRDAGIPYAEVASRPNLVLPVYQEAGSTLLWDEPNPWFDGWLRRDPPTGLVPLTLPLRDLSDISEISAEQALDGDVARMESIAKKYKAFGVFVIVAQRTTDPVNNAPALDVSVIHYPPGEQATETTRNFRAREGSNVTDMIDWAVGEVNLDIEEIWKAENLQQADSEQRIRLVVPVTRLSDWLDVRRKISAIPSVKRVDVARLTVREAEVDLMFFGQPDQLRRALALKDLDMEYQSDKDVWVVRRQPRQ